MTSVLLDPLLRIGARRRAQRQLDLVIPDVLDLFVVTLQAGYLPFDAVRELQSLVHPVVGTVLGEVVARVHRGERFADALDALDEALGARVVALTTTIAAAERNGLPLTPAIDRIADEARQHRRRQAEAAARELPVKLSFPLVLCTLPAFVLITIVPLLVGALSSLSGR